MPLLVPVLAGLSVVTVLGAYWLGSRRALPATPPAGMALSTATTGSPPGSPPPLIGTPREQADRLFERIMQARARGDGEEVRFFLPMALSAYDVVEDLDADGLFHLGLLQIEAERAADAAATAERIRARDSRHLFGHALAAEAALASGDSASALDAFERYLARYDAEIARDVPEYAMHRPALDDYRDQALRLIGS